MNLIYGQAAVKKEVSGGLKSYVNERYGFSFQYPANWQKENKDVEAIDRKGAVTSVEINFMDSTTKTSLSVAYHLAPRGAELYKFQLADYKAAKGFYTKSRKQVTVAGVQGIQGVSSITKDGKGNKQNPIVRLIVVDFLDKNKTGEFQLQFKTPITCETAESARLKKLLASFKITN